ncbi:MAG: GlsB/YeaQ/YmgE family stress response membrane protein [Planctomycetota bacterium]
MDGLDPAQSVLLHDTAQTLVNDVLVWIGFGTVLGLLAKGLLPGRDPGGAIAMVIMSIGGTIMSCGLVSFFNNGLRILPVHPLGMFVSLVGTLIVLFFYKGLSSYYFVEGEYVTSQHRRTRRFGRRRYSSAVYED